MIAALYSADPENPDLNVIKDVLLQLKDTPDYSGPATFFCQALCGR